MKRIICQATGLLIAVLLLSSGFHASAAWGQKGTKTERANANMNLGEYTGLKHAIGCKDFENQSGWHGHWKIGNNLSIMLESALYDSGRFVVVEREKLKDIIAEQDLVTSGRAAKAKKAAKTGMIRPARYIGAGAVTEVEEATSGGGGGISFGGFRVGGKSSKAHIALIVKLVDTTTGEIVAKERIVGKAGRSGLNVGMTKWGVNTDMGGFQKTPLGEAAQDCINQAAAFIAKQMEEFPFEGSVIKTVKGQVLINRGSEYGVEAGQELVMSTEGEMLMDPDTGAVLGQMDGEEIGRLKVTKVAEKFAYCDVLSGEKNPEPATVVRAE